MNDKLEYDALKKFESTRKDVENSNKAAFSNSQDENG